MNATKLTTGGPSTLRIRRTLSQRPVVLMNDLPGVTARAVPAPSADVAGGSQLSIVARQKPCYAYAGFDNHGSRYIGPFQYYAGAAANNALGLNERLAVNFAGAAPLAEILYHFDAYVQPVNVATPISRPGGASLTNVGFRDRVGVD